MLSATAGLCTVLYLELVDIGVRTAIIAFFINHGFIGIDITNIQLPGEARILIKSVPDSVETEHRRLVRKYV